MVWYSAGIAAVGRFLSIYAIRAGASPVDLGWISSLPALIVLITASFGGWWSRRYPNAARAIYWPALGQRFAFLLPALTPLLPLRWQPLWLILSVSIPAIPQGVAAVPFMVMMRDAVYPSQMPRLLALRQIAANACVAIAAIIFGLWLEAAPYPLNYVIMFLLSFALSLISLYYCTSIRELSPESDAAVNVAPAIRQTQANPWRERSFQKIAFITVTIHIAFFILVPLVPLFLVSRLGADEGYMAIYALVELAAGTLGSILGPYVERRIGARPMIALCIAFTALNGVIIALAPNLTVALFAAIFSGAFWTMGAGVSLYNFIYANTPNERMTDYSTAFNQVANLAIFIAPMIGSVLANSGMSLVLLMLIGGALRLLAAPMVESSLFRKFMPPVARPQPASVREAQTEPLREREWERELQPELNLELEHETEAVPQPNPL